MKAGLNSIRQVIAGLLCLSLMLWTVLPSASHTPTVIETVQEHMEMIAEHGHSHGFEEDLFWAMHGHSHDNVDHDHSQMILLASGNSTIVESYNDLWALDQATLRATDLSRIDRPPRV